MENLPQILNSVTKTEVFLIIANACFITLWLSKTYAVNSLKFHLMDSREHGHKLYMMYIEQSNQFLSIIAQWQKCQNERDELIREKLSSKVDQPIP